MPVPLEPSVPVPVEIVVTAPVCGSMRDTAVSVPWVTYTLPSGPTATPYARSVARVFIVRVFASMATSSDPSVAA